MIRIDTSIFIPIYEQIKDQLKLRIAAHILKPHDVLPSIRELASKLLINPNTVARAYRELEREGFIYTRKGKGCFVSDSSFSLAKKARIEILENIFDGAIKEAKEYELTADDIKALFHNRLHTIFKNIREDSNG
ncbi:MAG: GntR family transcriptional regulator [Candidatus Aminicenantes bacterium]|jgi:GntR family transcriptional regulator